VLSLLSGEANAKGRTTKEFRVSRLNVNGDTH
jgi:hypothetical protein